MANYKESLLPESKEAKKPSCALIFVLFLSLITLGFSVLLYFTGITSKVLISEYSLSLRQIAIFLGTTNLQTVGTRV